MAEPQRSEEQQRQPRHTAPSRDAPTDLRPHFLKVLPPLSGASLWGSPCGGHVPVSWVCVVVCCCSNHGMLHLHIALLCLRVTAHHSQFGYLSVWDQWTNVWQAEDSCILYEEQAPTSSPSSSVYYVHGGQTSSSSSSSFSSFTSSLAITQMTLSSPTLFK